VQERIVFLDRKAIRVPLRRPTFPHLWHEYAHTPPEQTIRRLLDAGDLGATVAISNRVAIDAATLAAVPSLRLVAVSATGYDHVDIASCRDRGVTVCNVRDWSVSVPEHVFALLLALRRQLPAYQDVLRRGRWQESETYGLLLEPLPHTLAGATLGLIGYGALGKRVAVLAQGFAMNVLLAEHKGAPSVREGRVRFEDVLARSDVLVVLCPLNEKTRNLIGAAELARMRREAVLVNCARGGIVSETALARALVDGAIGGAGVDVLSEEPPRQGNPLLALHLPNLIVTPHMAWASIESLENLAEQLIGNIEAFVAGTPRNLVTPARSSPPAPDPGPRGLSGKQSSLDQRRYGTGGGDSTPRACR
jgi:glycerate dehydrogenase